VAGVENKLKIKNYGWCSLVSKVQGISQRLFQQK